MPSDEGRDFATDESLALSQVLLALDRARVDRNYRSPTYLRTDLAAFLSSRPSGIYWLQAPAHVGKTIFIQGPAEDGDLAESHINGDFARKADGRIVAYYCRKEHRTGVVGLINLTIGACRRAPPALRRSASPAMDPQPVKGPVGRPDRRPPLAHPPHPPERHRTPRESPSPTAAYPTSVRRRW